MSDPPPDRRRGPVMVETPGEGRPGPARRGPVLIEGGPALETPAPGPDSAPPVPDDPAPGAGPGAPPPAPVRRDWLGRAIGAAFLALVLLILGTAAVDFVMALMRHSAALGWTATGLIALVVLGLAGREIAALNRLDRIAELQALGRRAAAGADLAAARELSAGIGALYARRPELAWDLARLAETRAELLDADAVLDATERMALARPDAAALAEVERAARQVAIATALLPRMLADTAAVLTINLRMIRRIAQIYGGRGGVAGSWRLIRRVTGHLVATAAVSALDDLVGAALGGGVLARLSRRAGEGLVNAALTARVGIAAIEVTRPLPHRALPRPSVTAILRRAAAGIVPGGEREPPAAGAPDAERG